MLSVARQPGRGGRSRFAVDRHRRREAVSFPDHGLYESGFIRIVAQRQSDFANGGVNALIDVDENSRAPKPVRELFACNQFSVSLYQEEEQLHRPPFEAQNAFSPLQPIPQLVKCEFPEMEYVSRACPHRAAGLLALKIMRHKQLSSNYSVVWPFTKTSYEFHSISIAPEWPL